MLGGLAGVAEQVVLQRLQLDAEELELLLVHVLRRRAWPAASASVRSRPALVFQALASFGSVLCACARRVELEVVHLPGRRARRREPVGEPRGRRRQRRLHGGDEVLRRAAPGLARHEAVGRSKRAPGHRRHRDGDLGRDGGGRWAAAAWRAGAGDRLVGARACARRLRRHGARLRPSWPGAALAWRRGFWPVRLAWRGALAPACAGAASSAAPAWLRGRRLGRRRLLGRPRAACSPAAAFFAVVFAAGVLLTGSPRNGGATLVRKARREGRGRFGRRGL